MSGHRIVRTVMITIALGVASSSLSAQDFRIAGGVALPREGRGGTIGGQGQASIEMGPRNAGFGVRLDVLYAQTSGSALSLTDVVKNGQTTRTYAAAGGIFYHRDVRDFAPYVIAGLGAYGQTASSGVALGANGGVGVDWAGSRSRPFMEARIHRFRGDAGSIAVERRERSLISALIGLRF